MKTIKISKKALDEASRDCLFMNENETFFDYLNRLEKEELEAKQILSQYYPETAQNATTDAQGDVDGRSDVSHKKTKQRGYRRK